MDKPMIYKSLYLLFFLILTALPFIIYFINLRSDKMIQETEDPKTEPFTYNVSDSDDDGDEIDITTIDNNNNNSNNDESVICKHQSQYSAATATENQWTNNNLQSSNIIIDSNVSNFVIENFNKILTLKNDGLIINTLPRLLAIKNGIFKSIEIEPIKGKLTNLQIYGIQNYISPNENPQNSDFKTLFSIILDSTTKDSENIIFNYVDHIVDSSKKPYKKILLTWDDDIKAILTDGTTYTLIPKSQAKYSRIYTLYVNNTTPLKFKCKYGSR